MSGYAALRWLAGREHMTHHAIQYLISCEHATCAVPEAHREIFKGEEEVVASGEGWEPGALNLAQAFSMRYRTPLVHGDVTRLLIDLERDGDARWSRYTAELPEATRLKLADRHERPFRTQLSQRVRDGARRQQPLLHLLVHTSPEVDGRVILETFSGMRPAEELASAWRGLLRAANVDVMHLHNATPNALEAWLTGQAGDAGYTPVRLTVAQSFFLEGRPRRWEEMKKLLIETLNQAVSEAPPLSGPESRAIAQG